MLEDWASELAAKLGRPVEAIMHRGLSAYDFSQSRFVEVREPSGLVVRLPSAFAVVRPSAALAAVFTEHSGYLEFDLKPNAVVAEITEQLYWHAPDDGS